MKAWKKAMGALVPVNDLSLESFDLLREGGVQAQTRDAKSFLAAYRTEQERTTLLEEIEHIHAAGQAIEFDVLTGEEARAVEPLAVRRRSAPRSACVTSASSTLAPTCTRSPTRCATAGARSSPAPPWST